MQFTTIVATTIMAFACGITALPAPTAQVTLRTFNDVTGTGTAATVPVDNANCYVSDLFRDTPIGQDGLVNKAVGNSGA
ncbi:hypothetical protein EK21DRAFT_109634 [Setomelanomma holmii]|uniref:Uncharacterized protein n=1 Tax=Setomelanomma holmii TaxID=210430 RepID=A0A9P4HFZ9_9PLEO|nr:hypothetical protein EK21DRAFT_109634 [Setomelanomma holmii]